MQAAIAEWEAKLPPRSGAGNTVQPLPDPKDKIEVQNLLHKAMLASDDHRSSEARQYLEKALQIDPTSPTAHRQLGELEFSTGDFSKAAVHLKRAAELRPRIPPLSSNWARPWRNPAIGPERGMRSNRV